MAYRKLRPPRPGEVALFVSSRATRYQEELWQTGRQIRFDPAPCCRKAYKNGGAVVISPENGLWKCFACGTKGNFYWLTKLWGDPLSDPYEDAKPINTRAYDALRARSRRLVTGNHYPDLLAYCHARGFADSTLDAFRVTTCGPEALRWPMLAWTGGRLEIVNARIRQCVGRDEQRISKRDGHILPNDWFEVKGGPSLAIGNHLLGAEPRLWAAEKPAWCAEWLDPSRDTPEWRMKLGTPFATVRRVLVTEGQWDAMTAWQIGIPNVLSLPNGASAVDVGNLLRFVPEDAEVWLATDMDEAGKKSAECFFAQVAPNRLARIIMPAKDLNKWLENDPGLTAEMVIAAARGVGAGRIEPKAEPKWLDLSEPVAAEADAWGDLIVETPWPRFTARIGGGLRACQTMGILAPSGIGKTSILNNIIAHAAGRGVMCGAVQLEGARNAVRSKLRAQVKGWIHDELDADGLKQVFSRIMLSKLEGKDVKVEETLDELERMAEAGCKLLGMDNWDYAIPDGMNGERVKMKAYARMQEICRKYHAHGIVVWQPSKVDRDEIVNSGTQKGLSRSFQDSDIYLNVNKFGNARRLQVEKARVEGVDDSDAASLIWLKYDRERCCLFETEGQGALTPVGRPLAP